MLSKWWIVTILYMGLIFYLSSLSYVGWELEIERELFKGYTTSMAVKHVVEYFILGFLLFLSLRKSKIDIFQSYVGTLFAGVVYGVLDEVHQSFVPFRVMSLEDMLVNSLGVFIGTMVFLLFTAITLSWRSKD